MCVLFRVTNLKTEIYYNLLLFSCLCFEIEDSGELKKKKKKNINRRNHQITNEHMFFIVHTIHRRERKNIKINITW